MSTAAERRRRTKLLTDASARKSLVGGLARMTGSAPVWVQGVVVKIRAGANFLLDDGTGVVSITTALLPSVDAPGALDAVVPGAYVMAVGHCMRDGAGGTTAVRATTVRALEGVGPMAESQWHLELADAYLRQKGK